MQQPKIFIWILVLLLLSALSYCYCWWCLNGRNRPLFSSSSSSSSSFSFSLASISPPARCNIPLYYFLLSSASISPPGSSSLSPCFLQRFFSFPIYIYFWAFGQKCQTHIWDFYYVVLSKSHLLYTWDSLLHIFLFPTFYLFFVYIYIYIERERERCDSNLNLSCVIYY